MEAASEPLAGSVRQKAAMCSPERSHEHTGYIKHHKFRMLKNQHHGSWSEYLRPASAGTSPSGPDSRRAGCP